MSTTANRVPDGRPAGGQFARHELPETGTSLEADTLLSDTPDLSPGQRAAALAMDGAQLGAEIGAVVTLDGDEPGCPTVSFTKQGAWSIVSIVPNDPKPYLVQTFTEDDAVTGKRRPVDLATAAEVFTTVRRALDGWA